MKKWMKSCSMLLFLVLLLCGCNPSLDSIYATESGTSEAVSEYSGTPYVEMDGNVPQFDEEEYTTEAFEMYSELDELGRCGVAYANICQELMPTEERGQIGSVKPSGWHTVKYNGIVDGNYLYNRCHLIGFQLAGENANKKNLVTGTRYLNVTGMLPFENEVADYVQETDHHVLYRVTPVFEGDNLVASGVQMEAASVEDDTIRFNVFVYNIQPGITIDYATGESWITEDGNGTSAESGTIEEEQVYILNKNTKKFHMPDCEYVKDMKPQNRSESNLSYDELISYGNEPCRKCIPK
ncbi:MAG: DNA/RNA non-specific endonuclease [Eubacterium sp.]|nr:DNA/RNA non-specific endonuclease [Eubacterium sp.]